MRDGVPRFNFCEAATTDDLSTCTETYGPRSCPGDMPQNSLNTAPNADAASTLMRSCTHTEEKAAPARNECPPTLITPHKANDDASDCARVTVDASCVAEHHASSCECSVTPDNSSNSSKPPLPFCTGISVTHPTSHLFSSVFTPSKIEYDHKKTLASLPPSCSCISPYINGCSSLFCGILYAAISLSRSIRQYRGTLRGTRSHSFVLR